MKQPVQVLIYPVRKIGSVLEYLLLRRLLSLGGFWQPVTGGLEKGENLIEAAKRELFEETGFVPVFIEKIDYSYSFHVEDKWQRFYAAGIENIIEYVFIIFAENHGCKPVDEC